jgi:Enoyl-CoA hydratase/carnithine racemase
MSQFPSRPAESLGLQEVGYRKADQVATITLNRPQNYNAYSTRALEELASAFRDASFDDGVGVIVFTGAGHHAFCTGGDVKEYAADYVTTPRDYWKYMALFRAYIESILNTGKPVIARLNGMAVGGGNETQLACDLTVMAQHAFIKQVGTQVGSVACGGSTQWLPITVGDKRAREILLLNEPVPAIKALDWGLVNWVVPSVRHGDEWIEVANADEIKRALAGKDGYRIDLSRLDAQVQAVATRLLASFPECTRYTKSRSTSGRTSPGTRRCGTRRTGWRSTTPAGSPWKACARSSRSAPRGTACCASARPRAGRLKRPGDRRPACVRSAAPTTCRPRTSSAARAARRSRRRPPPVHERPPRDGRGRPHPARAGSSAGQHPHARGAARAA